MAATNQQQAVAVSTERLRALIAECLAVIEAINRFAGVQDEAGLVADLHELVVDVARDVRFAVDDDDWRELYASAGRVVDEYFAPEVVAA